MPASTANNHSRTTPSSRGFTIIEIMVVVAIVSVLVTLLLPSLSSAKAVGLHVKCAGQLRQHGIAMSTYASDMKGYFPSFGGPVANDYSTWYRTNTSACGQLYDIKYNTGSLAYFSDYLNNASKNGDLVATKVNPVNYCPAIDWVHWQYYIFTTGTYQFSYFYAKLPNSVTPSFAGYNFYPGSKFYQPPPSNYNSDFDTRIRREDGNEILATDILLKLQNASNVGAGVFPGGQASMCTTNYPYFNPHAGNANTATATDSFHQLTANGAVQGYRASDAKLMMGFGQGGVQGNYAYGFKTANGVTGDSPNDDGPYFKSF